MKEIPEQKRRSYKVNWVLAFHAQRLLPWNYRLAWTCLSVIEWGTLLGGPALIIFGHWLLGLGVLAGCFCIIMPASRKTACEFILENTLENAEFRRIMCETGVLVDQTTHETNVKTNATEGKEN